MNKDNKEPRGLDYWQDKALPMEDLPHLTGYTFRDPDLIGGASLVPYGEIKKDPVRFDNGQRYELRKATPEEQQATLKAPIGLLEDFNGFGDGIDLRRYNASERARKEQQRARITDYTREQEQPQEEQEKEPTGLQGALYFGLGWLLGK